MNYLCIELRPNSIFITIWIGEVKSPATREAEDVLNHLAAGRCDSLNLHSQ
jgi:hypothetical protein